MLFLAFMLCRWCHCSSRESLAGLLFEELAARVAIVEIGDVTEVLRLHSAAHFKRQVLVHVQEHVRHVDVLAAVAILVGG